MNKFLLFILLCLPLAVSADFNICDDGLESWHVCDDVTAVSVSDVSNTEFVDSTTVTGGDTQTGPDLTATPKNVGFTSLSTETLALNTSYEVGWRSS